MIKIFRDQNDYLLKNSTRSIRVEDFSFDGLFQSDSPIEFVNSFFENARSEVPDGELPDLKTQPWLPPITSQEVWAAGVTYFKSRSARMEESEESGGDHFYNLVYEAERPELFFKSTGPRARGHLAPVCIRSDSSWDVPEPELTLAINKFGSIFGYTIGNDMSSRSIEGENPLYLPQAKVYRGSCAIGPCLVVAEADEEVVSDETKISIMIERAGSEVFAGSTNVSQIKRSFAELAEFLFRDNEFPDGAYLMTGTGVVPDSTFTLKSGDAVQIEIDGLGVLKNSVE
jgi:2-dehydro-3-deoxy-D-arabinonate dehydratase